jgi:hypothetical protein
MTESIVNSIANFRFSRYSLAMMNYTSIDVNERWQAFQAAAYAEQVALFEQSLREGMHQPDMIQDMVRTLYEQSLRAGEYERFVGWITAVQQQVPTIFEEYGGQWLYWQLNQALASGQPAAKEAAITALTNAVTDHYGFFLRGLDLLAYRGETAVMVQMMRTAWPVVRDDQTIFRSATDQFAARATDQIIFRYLEETAEPDPHDATLLADLGQFFPIDPAGLGRFFDHLRRRAGQTWQMADLMADDNDSQTLAQNWNTLMVEFLGYLYYEEKVPLSKGDLARHQFPHYFTSRRTGQLEPRVDMGNLMARHKPIPPRPDESRHPLCPDPTTLKEYISKLLHYARPQLVQAAVVYEMAPAWLRFLQKQQLIDVHQQSENWQKLQPLAADLADFWQVQHLNLNWDT